jgi:hypothetical protein
MLADAVIHMPVTDLLFDICRHACDEWEEMLTVNEWFPPHIWTMGLDIIKVLFIHQLMHQ